MCISISPSLVNTEERMKSVVNVYIIITDTFDNDAKQHIYVFKKH